MGAYTEIVDFTFTANETSRTFSGLSITKDDFVKVVMTHVNGSASETTIQIFPNTSAGVSGFNTGTNYHNQLLLGNGSSVVAVRPTGASCLFTPGNQTSANIGYIKISENDRYNSFFNNSVSTNNTIGNAFRYATSSGVTFADAITSLTFTSNQTNGLGTGSRIQIYRLDAEKVADFVTTSNSTQVDIPFPTGTFSPAIDKDSEYLLVSDINNSSGGTTDYLLTPNDLTTTSGYFVQRLIGNGSTAQAVRTNQPRYTECLGNTRVVARTHIKLSNIGAFTTQSYGFDQVGTSTSRLLNSFVSSTAENITSITKLNIRASITNAIGTGSRFILYKLYE